MITTKNFKGVYKGESASLAKLIELTAKIQNIERIRFTTSHPYEFKDDLVQIYDKVPELVSHVHLPVQSGSDKVGQWTRQSRNVRDDYKRFVGGDVKHVNAIAIMTDTDDSGRFAGAFYGEIRFSSTC